MGGNQATQWRRVRRAQNLFMLGLCWLAALLAMLPLMLVLYHIGKTGMASVNLEFFTHLPKPVGESGGGMRPGIVGSLIIVGIASLAGLPVGILGGIYLAEFPNHRVGGWVRFAADVLSGVPSIVLGVVAYTLLVVPMKRFSALAGGMALGLIMIPIVLRTTEEMIRLVPSSLREASLALGIPRWRTALGIVLPAARAGIVTGVLLSAARVMGETAPLLFTALGNNFFSLDIDRPMASMPVQIYSYAISPYEDWHRMAWAGALVLVGIIAVFSLLARYATRDRLGYRS